MENRAYRLDLRVTYEERKEAMELANRLGLTVSDLVRILLRLPAGYAEGTEARPVLVIDTTSAFKLARETRWWGHQYNQIAHALNRIAPQFRSIEIEFSLIVPAGALILLSNQMNFFARASYRSIIRAGKRKGARCTSSRRRRGAAGSASR